MNASELALDLVQLDVAEREELLAELPEERRAELSALISDLTPWVKQGRAPSLALHDRLASAHASEPMSHDSSARVHASASMLRDGLSLAHASGPALRNGFMQAHTSEPVLRDGLQPRGRASAFDDEWARVEADESVPASLRLLSEGQLHALLAQEPQAVQSRLVHAVRSNELSHYPSAVRRVVVGHLTRRCSANAVPLESPPQRSRPWWRSLWRRIA